MKGGAFEWFLCALTVALIVLKLCGVTAMSWVWVFAPIWIPAAILLAFFVVTLIWSCIR